MTVSDTGVVDLITVDRVNGGCVLTITDHMDWDDSDHLPTLQEKINTYLAFIESGEILEQCSTANENTIRIDVVMLHEPSDEAIVFLEQAAAIISEAGFSLTWRKLEDDAQQHAAANAIRRFSALDTKTSHR